MECGVETVGRKAGFLLDRIRRRPRPRNRQTRKSSCQSRTREAADPSGDWFWPYRHRGLRRHSRCQLTRHRRRCQAAFTRTVAPTSRTLALRAAPRPSTHPGYPPQPQISAMVRPQPVQIPARALSTQTATHGDSGGSIIARGYHRLSCQGVRPEWRGKQTSLTFVFS